MEKLVIDRGRWLTGEALDIWMSAAYTHASKLRVSCGLLCCMGFYGEALGYTPEEMLERPYLTEVQGLQPAPNWLTKSMPVVVEFGPTTVEHSIAVVNDRGRGVEREAAIKKLFLEHGGIEVEFVGDYADAVKIANEATAHLPRVSFFRGLE